MSELVNKTHFDWHFSQWLVFQSSSFCFYSDWTIFFSGQSPSPLRSDLELRRSPRRSRSPMRADHEPRRSSGQSPSPLHSDLELRRSPQLSPVRSDVELCSYPRRSRSPMRADHKLRTPRRRHGPHSVFFDHQPKTIQKEMRRRSMGYFSPHASSMSRPASGTICYNLRTEKS